jgi:hypothetical protein
MFPAAPVEEPPNNPRAATGWRGKRTALAAPTPSYMTDPGAKWPMRLRAISEPKGLSAHARGGMLTEDFWDRATKGRLGAISLRRRKWGPSEPKRSRAQLMGRSWPTLRTDDFYCPPRGVPKVIEATARFIRSAGPRGSPGEVCHRGRAPLRRLPVTVGRAQTYRCSRYVRSYSTLTEDFAYREWSRWGSSSPKGE